MSEDKVRAFLDALTRLTREHGLVLGSCGCCQAINVTTLTPDEAGGRYTASIDPDDVDQPAQSMGWTREG